MENSKQYYIFIRSTKEKVPVTKEEFDAYYHDIDNYRRKQQRRGQCVCPKSKQLECDMDCLTCPFRRAGNVCSTDEIACEINGHEISYLDTLYDDSPLIDDMIADSAELQLLFKRLQELMPQAVEIGKLRQPRINQDKVALPKKNMKKGKISLIQSSQRRTDSDRRP